MKILFYFSLEWLQTSLHGCTRIPYISNCNFLCACLAEAEVMHRVLVLSALISVFCVCALQGQSVEHVTFVDKATTPRGVTKSHSLFSVFNN